MINEAFSNISQARVAALDCLTAVRNGAYVEDALLERLTGEMDPRDRALATELCYGVTRWASRLDSIIQRRSKNPKARIKPAIREILRLALFQIFLLDKIPPHAAVNDAVEQAKLLSGHRGGAFVNGLLRNALRNKDSSDPPPGGDSRSLAQYYSHPQWLVQRWLNKKGLPKTIKILEGNNSRPGLYIRVNTLKTDPAELRKLFDKNGIDHVQSSLLPGALMVESGGIPVKDLPGFSEGLFSVQDPASQMISLIVDPAPNERILDACAASGGKTSHMAALMENQGEIVAVDKDESRLQAMESNLKRLGAHCVKLCLGDSSDSGFLSGLGLFDRALVDAPCSNLGTLRHNPEVKGRIKPDRLPDLANQQLGIIRAVSSVLKPESKLVYAVCSITEEETCDLMDRFLSERTDYDLQRVDTSRLGAASQGLVDEKGFFSTFGAEVSEPLDGFFAAALLKRP